MIYNAPNYSRRQLVVSEPKVRKAKTEKGGAGQSAVALREPRGARRKRETRRKLLDAAFRLMAEHGMDAVAINQITEAADVGLGSFYNHFESKEAIYDAVMDSLFEEFGDALDSLVADIEDPAEVIAVSVRHTILRARREPLWGRFLLQEGLSPRALSRGLGVRLMRDLQIGLSKKRFVVQDPLVTLITVGSSVLGGIAVEVQISGQAAEVQISGPAAEVPGILGANTEDLPERVATVLLNNLGVNFDIAAEVARRPLPVMTTTGESGLE